MILSAILTGSSGRVIFIENTITLHAICFILTEPGWRVNSYSEPLCRHIPSLYDTSQDILHRSAGTGA